MRPNSIKTAKKSERPLDVFLATPLTSCVNLPPATCDWLSLMPLYFLHRSDNEVRSERDHDLNSSAIKTSQAQFS